MEVKSLGDVHLQINEWLDLYNSAHVDVAGLLCDRHDPQRRALNFESAAGRVESLSYGELADKSRRFAHVLRGLGIEKGDRVALLLPKTPELLIAAVALWRLGAVYIPLFTAFGPEAVEVRVEDSGAKVILTDTANRPKLDGVRGRTIVNIDDRDGQGVGEDVPFHASLNRADPLDENTKTDGKDMLVLLYTSGTTGQPKGVKVPVHALATFESYMRFALDVREDDQFWNMADPGWAYGLYYGILGPLLLGKTILYYQGAFDPARAIDLMRRYEITNFASAPTAYRVFRSANLGKPGGLKLRVASSAGEPLNPELYTWAKETLGVELFDHFGQTELGMAICNHHHPALSRPIKPGSMGQAMPGFRVVILDDQGNEQGDGVEGHLAIDRHASPLCIFEEYYNAPDRTADRLMHHGRYYLAGDNASRDADGDYFFSGRGDDIILSAGYRIGPFEVESALVHHPAVAEAAVVGKPDELKGEIVKAHVVLKPGQAATDALKEELSLFVKQKLAAHAYPREIVFVDQLPKTPSGKIQRFLLRAQA